MKKNELNVVGLQEMNLQEMENVNGGVGPIIWFIFSLAFAECLDMDRGRDFSNGAQSARDFWN